jgi:hypothetical protein
MRLTDSLPSVEVSAASASNLRHDPVLTELVIQRYPGLVLLAVACVVRLLVHV